MAETSTTTARVDTHDRPYMVTHRVLDLVLFLIEGFLFLEFVLKGLGANRSADFYQFVNGIASSLMVPFRFIFPATAAGEAVFDWSILFAMLVYSLLFYVMRKIIAVAYTADNA